MISKQQKRKVRKRTKAAKFASSTYFDLFNSIVIDDDSEWDIFNEFTDILQRLQQLQRLHRKSNLLDLLQDCLMNFALNWFESQSKFISLHDFDIILTKAFSSSEFATNQTISLTSSKSSVSQKQQKLKISTSNHCQWCQLDYEIWNSHRLQYSSCVARNQQAYEFVLQLLEEHANEVIEKSTIFTSLDSQKQQEQQKSNALKIAKKIKINAIKNAKRVKSKALKAQEVAKSTSTLQDIDIFDSILTCENRQFSKFVEFLQHLQQCQHLYQKSDLLMLLLTYLWDFAFDIWFDKQTIMKLTSLSDWIEVLRVDFANVSFAKIKTSKIICMRCDSSFNFKKKLRKHVREQHAKKFINNSSLSINTLKSKCENEKKSTFDDSSISSISQEFEISIATSKQIFESTMIFETINSSKISHLSFNASKIVSKSMKNTSTQCSFTSSKSLFTKTFESKHQEISVWKLSEFCSFLSIDTIKSIYEIEKKSTVIETFVLQVSHISFTTLQSQITFEIISQKSSNLSIETLKVISESTKNESNQCLFVSMFSFFRTLESKHHEFIILKFESESSLLKISSDKSIWKSEKISVITCSSTSFTSQKSFILLSIFKRNCLICRIDVSSIKEHYFESSSCHETLRNRLKQQLARHAHQRKKEAQKQIEVEKEISSSVSSVCLNLSIATFKIVSESMKNASNQEVTCVRVICKLCKQNFNFNKKLYEHIRKHEVLKFVKNFHLSINVVNLICEIEKTSFASHKFSVSSAKSQKFIFEFAIAFETIILLKRSNLSSFTLETKSESTKKSTTCRRCKQSFKFNNKLHEHIRQHHDQKFVRNFDFRTFASKLTYKIKKKSIVICSFALLASQKISILFATSRSQKFWSTIFKSVIASTRSCLSFATLEIASK